MTTQPAQTPKAQIVRTTPKPSERMTHRAIQEMLNFNKNNPFAKDCYKLMQQAYLNSLLHKKDLGKHYGKVFFPNQQTNKLHAPTDLRYRLSKNDPTGKESIETLKILNGLYVFGAWRNTLGIYTLDDEIAQECYKTRLPDDAPMDIFTKLPEWCVYIDISNANIGIHLQLNEQDNSTLTAYPLYGFWALYDWAFLDYSKKPYFVLQFFLHYCEQDQEYFTPCGIILDENLTLGEALQKSREFGLGTPQEFELISNLLLSCLLWLCVDEPEITHKEQPIGRSDLLKPKYGTNKKTGAFVPPNEPFYYQIGSRLGAEIRTYKKQLADYDNDLKNNRKPTRKRPHVRKGHWHGYWVGAGEHKEFSYRWLPMCYVNFNNKSKAG